MPSDVVYDAVRAHLGANWSETDIAWENENFVPPVEAGWVAVEVSGTTYAQQSIGAETQAANRWDEEGVLWVHVFVPTGTGSSTARRRAKAIADIFRGAKLLDDALEFTDASIGLGDVGDDAGATWSITVSIDWRLMEA